MEKFLISLVNVKTEHDFYQRIIEAFKFPDWCGESPDAIKDLLAGYFDMNAEIKVVGTNTLSQELYEEFVLLKKVFDGVENFCNSIGKKVIFVYD